MEVYGLINYSLFLDKVFKVFGVQKTAHSKTAEAPGSYETDNKTYLHLVTGNGLIAIKELQM